MKFCPWAHGQNVDLATKPVQNVLRRRVFCLAAAATAATALAISVETCRKEVSLCPLHPLLIPKKKIKKPSHICKTKKMRDRKFVSLIVRIFL